MSDEPPVPAPPVPDPPGAAAEPAPALVNLLLRPEDFFRRPQTPWRWHHKLAAALVIGLAVGIDRADVAATSGRGADGWQSYWLIALGAAVVATPVRWFLGGYWFRTRLRLCGARKVDRARAQRLFALSDLVQAVPVVSLTALSALTWTPRDAPFWWISLMALIWGFLVSYRGVRASFPLSAWKVRFWFLLVPILFFAWLVGRKVAPGWRAVWRGILSTFGLS